MNPTTIPDGKMLSWKDGQWGLTEDLIKTVSAEYKDSEFEELLKDKGWYSSETFGNDAGTCFTIMRNTKVPDLAEVFVVEFWCNDSCWRIRVDGVANLIEMMAKLSPIALASSVGDSYVAKYLYELAMKADKANR